MVANNEVRANYATPLKKVKRLNNIMYFALKPQVCIILYSNVIPSKKWNPDVRGITRIVAMIVTR